MYHSMYHYKYIEIITLEAWIVWFGRLINRLRLYRGSHIVDYYYSLNFRYSYNYTIVEETDPTILDTIGVEDEDYGLNSTVRFSIHSLQHEKWFHIDPVTGVFKTLQKLDRELIGSSVNVTIKVSGTLAMYYNQVSKIGLRGYIRWLQLWILSSIRPSSQTLSEVGCFLKNFPGMESANLGNLKFITAKVCFWSNYLKKGCFRKIYADPGFKNKTVRYLLIPFIKKLLYIHFEHNCKCLSFVFAVCYSCSGSNVS